MAGLVRGHPRLRLASSLKQDVDARHEAGHDEMVKPCPAASTRPFRSTRCSTNSRARSRATTPRCWWRRPAPARPRGCRWRCSMSPGLKSKKIIMLEPRRIAARASAERMARTLGERVGETVGYRVRFGSKISRATRIEVVTEGIFSRQILDDPELIRRRRRAVRRVSRTFARCRSGAGAGARRANRLARGSAHSRDVGDARRRAGRQSCSATRR